MEGRWPENLPGMQRGGAGPRGVPVLRNVSRPQGAEGGGDRLIFAQRCAFLNRRCREGAGGFFRGHVHFGNLL